MLNFQVFVLLVLSVFVLTSCSGSDSGQSQSSNGSSTDGSGAVSSNAPVNCETGDQLAESVMSAINNKDIAALNALTDPSTFTANKDYLQRFFAALTGDTKVKNVVFSPTPADTEAKQIDSTDGDLLINLSEPQSFPTNGNASLGNATQLNLPAMKIGNSYRIHGQRGFGVSDFNL